MRRRYLAAILLVIWIATTAGTIYHGLDYSRIQSDDGYKRLVVCDRELDGIEANGYVVWAGDHGENYVTDENGRRSGCGHSAWKRLRVAGHGIGEGCPYFRCNFHWH